MTPSPGAPVDPLPTAAKTDTPSAPEKSPTDTAEKSSADKAVPAPVTAEMRREARKYRGRKHWPRAAALLAAGFTNPEVSAMCGIWKDTLLSWKRSPVFAKMIEYAEVEYSREAVKAHVKIAIRERIKAGKPPKADDGDDPGESQDPVDGDAGDEFGF